MPVTAKLSKLFYDRLGEQIANELVDWFNQVDATYRSDLRELNELNFARFDAKLEQRLAEFEAKLERRLAELDATWRVRWDKLDAKLEQSLALLDAKLDLRTAELRAEMAKQKTELIRWMVGLWLATLVPLGGLVLGLFIAFH
jgi:hypothetical protein